jgi:hypothetical protein
VDLFGATFVRAGFDEIVQRRLYGAMHPYSAMLSVPASEPTQTKSPPPRAARAQPLNLNGEEGPPQYDIEPPAPFGLIELNESAGFCYAYEIDHAVQTGAEKAIARKHAFEILAFSHISDGFVAAALTGDRRPARYIAVDAKRLPAQSRQVAAPMPWRAPSATQPRPLKSSAFSISLARRMNDLRQDKSKWLIVAKRGDHLFAEQPDRAHQVGFRQIGEIELAKEGVEHALVGERAHFFDDRLRRANDDEIVLQ